MQISTIISILGATSAVSGLAVPRSAPAPDVHEISTLGCKITLGYGYGCSTKVADPTTPSKRGEYFLPEALRKRGCNITLGYGYSCPWAVEGEEEQPEAEGSAPTTPTKRHEDSLPEDLQKRGCEIVLGYGYKCPFDVEVPEPEEPAPVTAVKRSDEGALHKRAWCNISLGYGYGCNA
ncbi:hypothetical protein BU26DRAFT_558213 [Trematosphaeria pertusa]|uniref:Ecp2 effector protein domain-containing protein n=1 Tax=Trematosphaeria pertusa TaxID=390896 RepID=A0A6A6J1M7_9PLEO|nr:uncharacterized protein BU26DRAFT_558213 [Trematosphaeria pertusa]KAF2256775.1 hypothetical protein BU26DRAFT_558213 [Trematosphaeria pertusa]